MTQGNQNRTLQHLPILYSNNTLISNICNIRFGDYYGVGSNHYFLNCRIVKIGGDPRYKTFMYDLGYPCKNHILRDCTYEGGAGAENVKWVDAKADHDFRVEWTVSITTATET